MERMRLILNLDTTSSLTYTERRQLIVPEVKVTCDGVITKWIVGAEWTFSGRYLYPELQVWRHIGNETYQKIAGTYIYRPLSMSPNKIYEYSKFAPIPVQSGDILGIFIPQDGISRLRLRSENTNSNSKNPTQHYHLFSDTSLAASPIDEIDIRNNELPLTRASQYPLVSVEICKYPPQYTYSCRYILCFVSPVRNPTSSVVVCEQSPHADVGVPTTFITLIVMIAPLSGQITMWDYVHISHCPLTLLICLDHPVTSLPFPSHLFFLPLQILPISSLVSTATSQPSPSPIPSTDQTSSSGQSSAAIAAGVGVGVAVTLVLLVVAVVAVILVLFLMRRRQNSKTLTNVEHKSHGGSPMGNPVYTGKP